jgi:hypothetical protein
MSWEQDGLFTPWGLIENAYPEVLQLSTTRLGIFDDPKLFILWALVVTLAALKLRRERQTWRT